VSNVLGQHTWTEASDLAQTISHVTYMSLGVWGPFKVMKLICSQFDYTFIEKLNHYYIANIA
jgi:hypothetical protein